MARTIPGKPARGSKTGRPIMVLLDLLGRKQTLRILWELRGEEALTFRELQSRCGDISPTVLNKRLAELRDSLIVEHHQHSGYALTRPGRELGKSLQSLDAWAKKWARHFES